MDQTSDCSEPPADAVSMTIRGIRTTHGLVVTAFSGSENVILDLDDQAPADLSFIQLIESARRTAERNGKSLSLRKPVGENIRRVLERGGFLPGSADTARFWLHQEVSP